MKTTLAIFTATLILALLSGCTGYPVDATQKVVPAPVQEAPLSATDKFSLVVYGFQVYLAETGAVISSEEDFDQIFVKYVEESEISIGTKRSSVKNILTSFSEKDWKEVLQVAGMIGTGAISTVVYVGNCKTGCLNIFNALWWACAHGASGFGWFVISESMMTNHPEPVLCGRVMDWERLLEVLEDQCPRFRVTWLTDGVKVTDLGRHRSSDYDFTISPEVLPVLLIIGTTTLVIAVIVTAPEAAPVLIPILLAP